MFVERQEAVNFRAVKTLHNIDFIFDRERRAKIFAGGMFRVLIDAGDFDLRAVGFEFGSNHFGVRIKRRVTAKCVGGRVHSDERVTIRNPFQKGVLVRQWQIAGRVGENNSVIIFQSCRRHFFRESFCQFFPPNFFRRCLFWLGSTSDDVHHSECAAL